MFNRKIKQLEDFYKQSPTTLWEKLLAFLILLFIVLMLVVASVALFAGEGGEQIKIILPDNGVGSEWIVAIAAIIGTVLTGVGVWVNYRRKK